MNIVLVEPEIPQNTGNIARTCVVTDTSLHLVKPLGFSTKDKYLKRAGLDYWHLLQIYYYDSFSQLQVKYPNGRYFFVTKEGSKGYTKVDFKKGDFLVFGKETTGLPKYLLKENEEYCIRIPMLNEARSLNLANSVAIVLFEALRQQDFLLLT